MDRGMNPGGLNPGQPDDNVENESEVFCMIPNRRRDREDEDVFCMIPNPESDKFEYEVYSTEDEELVKRVTNVKLDRGAESSDNYRKSSAEESIEDSQEHEYEEVSLYDGLDQDIPATAVLKSDYQNLEDIFETHKDSIYADCLAVYERLPTVEEFFEEYYLKYIQPYSWSGWWIKHQWERKLWPVPKRLMHPSVIKVINFDKTTMTYKIVPIAPDEFLGDPSEKVSFLWVPIHELECAKSVSDDFKYFQTFKRAHNIYLRFKLFLLLPSQKGMSAEGWFLFSKVSSIDLQYDLSFDGAICAKMKEEIIDTFCSIKEKEDLLSQYETDTNLSAEKFKTITCLNVDIDTLTLRLKFLSDPVVRPCLEANMVQTGMDYCEGLKDHDIVIVLDLGRSYDLGLLKNLQVRAAKFLARSGYTEEEAMSKPFRIVPTLYGAINKCADGSVIFLGPGKHELPGIGNFCRGGSLIGLPIDQTDDGNVKVVASGVGDIWFLFERSTENHLYEFSDIEFLIEADILSCHYTYAFCVLGGQLTLTDCTIKYNPSPKRSVVYLETNAIKISGPARLKLHRVKIDTFRCGMVVDENVDLDLNTCLLNSCNGAIKVNNQWGNINVEGLLLANCDSECIHELQLPNMQVSEAYDTKNNSPGPEKFRPLDMSATRALDAGVGRILLVHAYGFICPSDADFSDNTLGVNVSPANEQMRTHTV